MLPPEAIVARQLEAYNARDLEAFVATYHSEIEVYNSPEGSLRARGHEELRRVYGTFFQQSPQLHCEIRKRMTLGQYVIDEEFVTGTPNGNVSALAIYKIEENLISKVWLIK